MLYSVAGEVKGEKSKTGGRSVFDMSEACCESRRGVKTQAMRCMSGHSGKKVK